MELYSSSSTRAASIYPALLTSTSIPPYIFSASFTLASSWACGAVTSRSKMAAPASLRCWSRSCPLLAVAITWSPFARMLWTNCSPKPDEVPVTSQVSCGMMLESKVDREEKLIRTLWWIKKHLTVVKKIWGWAHAGESDWAARLRVECNAPKLLHEQAGLDETWVWVEGRRKMAIASSDLLTYPELRDGCTRLECRWPHDHIKMRKNSRKCA